MKKKTLEDVDFFEIIHGPSHEEQFAGVAEDIQAIGKDFFVHLPTSFLDESTGDHVLLNVASLNKRLRDVSRKIIEDVVRDTYPHNPTGWILHAPTRQNFSTGRGLFDPGNSETFDDSLLWVKSLSGNVLIENVPAAISWDSKIYMTEPYDIADLSGHGIPLVLDTAHLFTNEFEQDAFIARVNSILNDVEYVHIATLRQKVRHDIHGRIFDATEDEYPPVALLDNVLGMIVAAARDSSRIIRILCEPDGGPDVHKVNFVELKRRIKSTSLA